MKILVTLALMTSLASAAAAHSRVDRTTPEDGSTLGDVPAQISLDFADDIRLTRVEMTHQDHPSVRLDLGNQTSFDRVFTLPLQGMGEGTYHVEWRGLGKNGHAMQGAFTFTVE